MIKSTPHPSLPIAIHNYTNEVQYNNAWDPLTLAARTLITQTRTGAVVSRGFSKFFNHHERGAYEPTGDEEAVVVEEKLDGSFINMFWFAGEWHATSKAQFGGPYVQLALRILHGKYSGATERMDKEKTYIFELIDPRQPIGVKYKVQDIVLLSIISKDGQEPPPGFDWFFLPFTRPRILDARVVDVAELKKMNPVNEEGFVIKFYPSHGEYVGRPQRVKVKFNSYLALLNVKNNISPAGMVKLYTKSRSAIEDVDEKVVREQMAAAREKYFQSLHPLADDFGGEIWIQKIESIWSKIDNHFAKKERELWRLVAVFEAEGYITGSNQRLALKKRFTDRIGRGDVDIGLKSALQKWYGGASLQEQIKCFVGTLPVPTELKRERDLGVRNTDTIMITPWKKM